MSLRRQITSAKDVFYLNGHSVTKEQVLNTLQSAGLSKANPYYIIKQGTVSSIKDMLMKSHFMLIIREVKLFLILFVLQINDLATATDKKRLELITEVAGSLVWKELQPQNYSLLKGSELKIHI